MSIRAVLLACVLVAPHAFAQSDTYQDAHFLGFHSITNGTLCDPITGGCSDRHVQGYIVEAGGFRYMVSNPSDAEAPVIMPSPFIRRQPDILANMPPGTLIHIRLAEGKRIYIRDDAKGKERKYYVMSVEPIRH